MLILNVKSYYYDHFDIKKWKISTFKKVSGCTNEKIKNFWSRNQFFQGLTWLWG